MLITLLLIFCLLIFANLSVNKNTRKLLLRENLIILLILSSASIVFVTEALNIFKLINVLLVSLAWIAGDLLLLFYFAKNFADSKLKINLKFPDVQDTESKTMLFVVFLVATVTFILALAVAPNNIDAMSYHLARVMYWIQNGSINFYPTNISWQINNGQLASFIQLHFFLLSGGDRFANLVQWVFFIGNLLAASLVAKEFGEKSKGQLTAVFLCATIPMAILQASTTHDVLIVSFFILSFIYFSLRFLDSNEKKFIFLSGLSLGLGLFTKQIAYIYSLPFFIWVIFLFIRKFKAKKALFYLVLISAVAIFINLGFYLRNIELSHLPIFSIRNDYINSPLGLGSLASTMIKNIAVHISTPSQAINYKIHSLISELMKGFSITENSPGLNWVNFPFGIPPMIASEYTAPNTIHLILIIASSIYLISKKNRLKIKTYLLCILIGFVVFSALFKWQISASHLESQLFMVSTPVLAFAFVNWRRSIRYFFITILAASSFYFLFFNIYKPVISEKPIFGLSREEQYFKFTPEFYKPYKDIAKFVAKNKYKNIGVIFKEYYSEMEYPLWVLLKEENKDIKIEHVSVDNVTAKLSTGFKPDVVIYLGTDKKVLRKYIDQHITVIGIK